MGVKLDLLTLRAEHRLRVFENRVPRKIFSPKRGDVTGGLRKLHNVELHNTYSSQSVIGMMKSRRMRWTGHVHRFEDDIKMDFREIGRCGVDWIDLAQDRDQWRTLVNTAMNFSHKILGNC
jgi:hypothetical protein